MKKILALSFFFFSLNSYAQVTFQKSYGGLSPGEQISSASGQQTSDGGYVAGCWSYATGMAFDIWLIKTDSYGDTLWTRSYDFGGEDMCSSVYQTSDSGYILTGLGVYLLKTNSSGNFLWAKSYGIANGMTANYVEQTNDGGYIVTGSSNSAPFVPSVFVIKTDGSGNLQWAKEYGGAYNDEAECIRQTFDGGYVIAGTTLGFGAGGEDIWVIKTDAGGTLQWTKTYGGAGDEKGHEIVQTADSGYVIAGKSDDAPNPSYLIKTDGSGNLTWAKTYQGLYSFFVQQTADGGFISIDWNYAGLMKVNSSGNLIWAKHYPGNISSGSMSGQQTSDGGFFLAGFTLDTSGNNYSELFLIKTDSLGNGGCTNNLAITVSTPSFQVTSPSIIDTTITPVVTPRTATLGSRVHTSSLCVVGMDELSNEENSFSLFPNPARSELRIKNSELKIKDIEIYNTLGRKVLSKTVPSFSSRRRSLEDEVINISSLVPGIYFVKIKTDDGAKTQKLVVQR